MTQPTAATPGLGSSLRFGAGDLVFDDTRHDLACVTGFDALRQALVLTIETQLGSDRLNTGFGFDHLAVGAYAYGIYTRKEYVKLQLVRCLTQDRRVRDIREIFFQDDPRYAELQPAVDEAARQQIAAATRASRDYTVFVVVDTVTGDAVTASAGGTLG